jgi:DnaJ family protein B protein 12
MNKDEALKCLNISKTKYRSGDSSGAMKFAEKGKRLFDCTEINQWIQFLKENPTPSTPKQKLNKAKEEKQEKKEEEQPSRPYTPDQVSGIKKILDCKKKGDLYGIFGLEKSCSDNDIKKAYRKMALRFHPDKCGAPGTDDAFKAIGHAWTVLGDSDKRANYDQYGIDSESSSRPSPAGFSGFRGRPGFEGDISPEDLLRMFMGGGFGPGFGGTTFSMFILT